MQSNGPALETRIPIGVALKNLVRDALLPKGLSESEAAESGPGDEDVHGLILNLDSYPEEVKKFDVNGESK